MDTSTRGFRRQARQIVALLLALARLAECAATRSAPVCHLVTWLLWRGEAAARDHVETLTGRAILSPAPRDCASPGAEAMHLAACLRSLAAALSAVLAEAATPCRAVRAPATRAALRSLALPPALAMLALAVERRDSS